MNQKTKLLAGIFSVAATITISLGIYLILFFKSSNNLPISFQCFTQVVLLLTVIIGIFITIIFINKYLRVEQDFVNAEKRLKSNLEREKEWNDYICNKSELSKLKEEVEKINNKIETMEKGRSKLNVDFSKLREKMITLYVASRKNGDLVSLLSSKDDGLLEIDKLFQELENQLQVSNIKEEKTNEKKEEKPSK